MSARPEDVAAANDFLFRAGEASHYCADGACDCEKKLAAILTATRESEERRWQRALGHPTPEDAWKHVNEQRGLEVDRARREALEQAARSALGMTGPGNTADQCKGYSDACRDIAAALRRLAEEGKPACQS